MPLRLPEHTGITDRQVISRSISLRALDSEPTYFLTALKYRFWETAKAFALRHPGSYYYVAMAQALPSRHDLSKNTTNDRSKALRATAPEWMRFISPLLKCSMRPIFSQSSASTIYEVTSANNQRHLDGERRRLNTPSILSVTQ